jgi:hypothetical protein
MIPVGAEDMAELEQVLTALGGRAPQSAAEAPLPHLGAVLRGAATRLDTGRGFVLLRGLTLERLGEALAEPLLATLGAHLARAGRRGAAPGECCRRGAALALPCRCGGCRGAAGAAPAAGYGPDHAGRRRHRAQ